MASFHEYAVDLLFQVNGIDYIMFQFINADITYSYKCSVLKDVLLIGLMYLFIYFNYLFIFHLYLRDSEVRELPLQSSLQLDKLASDVRCSLDTIVHSCITGE